MARWVPFTMHVRIVPDHGSGQLKSKRFENWRDMQKIASLMFESLEGIAAIEIAEPGGGQHQSFGGTSRGGLSGLTRGGAAKPQFGETPAQVQITGFFDDTNEGNPQNHPEHQRISGGDTYTGPATAIPWSANPRPRVDNMVKTLKNAVEAAFGNDLPTGVTYNIFRVDMSGVIYGDRGYHFPR